MTRAPGGERTRPRDYHHLFFALWPEADVRERIDAAAQQLKRAHAPRGRWIRPHRYHLTLRYLGEHASLPDALLVAALAAGEAVRAGSFDLRLDVAASFANRSIPWWLGCGGVAQGFTELWREIAAGLAANGQPQRDDVDPVAHVTILRDADQRLPTMPIAPIDWPVRGFVLIDSHLGREARYEILRRWPLPDAG
jgi:RNA 2',3'-cyclic 3'-phosphodiesterase